MTIELSEYVIDAIADAIVKKMQEPKFIAKSDGTIEQIKNCDDCIFRKKWEKIGKLLSVILKKQTEQEPCEDCISRQAVLDIIRFEDKWLLDAKAHNADTEIAFSGMKSKVSDLPPVTPQPKTDVLDKIRAEIETQYGRCDICEYFEDYDYEENDISEYRPIGNIADILQIIDKYRAESEARNDTNSTADL